MISSIDSVLVRAAASSIASGRPSSERHSSSRRLVGSPRRAARGGRTARRRRRARAARARARPRRRRRAGPGWCTGSAGRARRRAGGPRAPRRRRGRARSCRGSATAGALLSRSSSAASPPATSSAAITVSSTSSARRRGFEPGQPDAAGQRARPVAIASAVLPIPPGPTTSTSRLPSSSVGERGDLGVAPDELGRQRRQVAGRARRSARVVRRGPAARAACSRGPGSRPSSSASRARTRW